MRRRSVQQHGGNTGGTERTVRRMWKLLALAAVIPLLVAAVLYRLGVPLGLPGRFVYQYSPVIPWRLRAVPAALLCAVIVALGTWLLSASQRARQRAGLACVALGLLALGFWSYLAPPDHLKQHVFNMESPSQDGAFTREAAHVERVRDYLRTFPQRALTPPAEMRGTRVISNPPGMTLLAWGARRLVESWPLLHELIHGQIRRQIQRDEAGTDERLEVDEAAFAVFVERAAVGIAFCWLLTVLWLLAALPLYALGRLFFSPAGAAVFCVSCLISPMTLLFAPGKDVAQLLTVALPLWLWFLAVLRRWRWAAALAGALGLAACVVSLVHVWLAVIVTLATLLWARKVPGQARRLVMRALLPAAAGALLIAAVLHLFCDLDVLATTWAVAHSQAEVTRGPQAMPVVWQLLGIPLFLLFAGPALWTCAAWRLRRQDSSSVGHDSARLGSYLLICTAGVMLATIGFTNLETPRLWLPFVPLLLLGLGLQLDAFRAPPARHRWLLAGLVGAQLMFSVLHWMLMDMREAENRLLSGEFFW